eukprot:612622-Hanusia_phi.AAC.1
MAFPKERPMGFVSFLLDYDALHIHGPGPTFRGQEEETAEEGRVLHVFVNSTANHCDRPPVIAATRSEAWAAVAPERINLARWVLTPRHPRIGDAPQAIMEWCDIERLRHKANVACIPTRGEHARTVTSVIHHVLSKAPHIRTVTLSGIGTAQGLNRRFRAPGMQAFPRDKVQRVRTEVEAAVWEYEGVDCRARGTLDIHHRKLPLHDAQHRRVQRHEGVPHVELDAADGVLGAEVVLVGHHLKRELRLAELDVAAQALGPVARDDLPGLEVEGHVVEVAEPEGAVQPRLIVLAQVVLEQQVELDLPLGRPAEAFQGLDRPVQADVLHKGILEHVAELAVHDAAHRDLAGPERRGELLADALVHPKVEEIDLLQNPPRREPPDEVLADELALRHEQAVGPLHPQPLQPLAVHQHMQEDAVFRRQ